MRRAFPNGLERRSHYGRALTLSTAGRSDGERYLLMIDELAWLVDHASRLAALRLELLRALQSALPMSDESGFTELKALVTNLIIMQTRLVDRDQGLSELLDRLVESGAVESVPVDDDSLRDAVRALAGAWEHVHGGPRA